MKTFYFLILCLIVSTLRINAQEKLFHNKISQIDSLLNGYDYYDRFSGSVILADEDSIWYHSCIGYRDFSKQLPNNKQSVYGIGSCTKQFTAAGILKLIEMNQLELDDHLSKYFPEIGPLSEKVTIYHLLTHSSGINKDIGRGDTFEEIIFPQANAISIDSLNTKFSPIGLSYTPGNSFEYNNYNYMLLAGIIEKVSGKDYNTFMQETFFQPIQLSSTYYDQKNAIPDTRALPYINLPFNYETPPYWDDSWAFGAGGMYTSAEDIYQWVKMLNHSKILTPESTSKMFSPLIRDGKEFYGFGWQISEIFGKKHVYHNGATNGYFCKVGFIPSEHLYIFIFSNHTHNLFDLDRTARLIEEINTQLMNIVFDKEFQIIPVPENPYDTTSNFPIHHCKIAGLDFRINPSNNGRITIQSEGRYSIFDLPFTFQLSEPGKRFNILESVVIAFGNKDYRTILSNSTTMLRTLVSEKKLAEIWEDLAGETGKLISWNCYRLPTNEHPNDYFVRMIYETKEIGIQFVFKKNKINGMFTDKRFSYNGPITVDCIELNKNQYFIDGFRYNYADGMIYNKNGKYFLQLLNSEFEIKE
jgi:CubicO group peptidase (beta-lactamase class C family)